MEIISGYIHQVLHKCYSYYMKTEYAYHNPRKKPKLTVSKQFSKKYSILTLLF